MEGQCTKVTKIMRERQTSSTTSTGDPVWALTGLSLQISTHPRSLKRHFKHHKIKISTKIISSRQKWAHQTWNIWTAPVLTTFTKRRPSNPSWSSHGWAGLRTSMSVFFCIILGFVFFRRSLRLTCVLFEDKANPILNLYKSKLRKKNDHNRNVVIYNYWLTDKGRKCWIQWCSFNKFPYFLS